MTGEDMVTAEAVTTDTIEETMATTVATTVTAETGNFLHRALSSKLTSETTTDEITVAGTTTIDEDHHHETLTEMIVNGEIIMIDETVRLALLGTIVDQTTVGPLRATQCPTLWNQTKAGPRFSPETRSSRRSSSLEYLVESTSTNTTISPVFIENGALLTRLFS